MSVNWTEQQLEAIETRGGNILVAAAAGSGKTAVLVERIIRMITDEKDPVSIDRLLVLTFTDAAAAEMKRKISAAVDKKLEELPDNEWLRQQSLRVGSACISTIHSFCRRIITNNAHLTDLPSGFSMIDDTENSVLKARAADEVLEKFYSRIDSQQGFFDLVTGFGGIKNDNTLREVILKMYEFIQSLAYPNRWFDYVRKSYRGAYLGKGVEETVWYKPITELIKSYASDISDIMDILYGIAEKEFMPDNYHTVYFNTVREGFKSSAQIKDTDSKEERAAFFEYIKSFKLPSERNQKDYDPELKKRVADLKKMINDKRKAAASLIDAFDAENAERLGRCYPVVRALCNIVKMTARAHKRLKAERGCIDFSDLEHGLLKLICNSRGEETPLCLKLRDYYEEILLDEFQDTNNLQFEIFSRISKQSGNLFMVGDVKQSIYKFRNADPSIFLQLYREYGEGKGGRLIRLFKNFRSRDEVVDSVNYIFSGIMSEKSGGIDYTADEYLIRGAEYKTGGDYRTELMIPDADENNETPPEICAAQRIKKLVLTERLPVTDKDSGELRPIRYGDIAVLAANWADCRAVEKALNSIGIAAMCEKSSHYLDSVEVATIMAFLQIIDNPIQDIPLIAVMRSPIFMFSGDELAQIRVCDKSKRFYDAVCVSARTNKKTAEFLGILNELRDCSKYMGVDEIVRKICNDLHYFSIVGAMDGGELRKENIKLLLARCADFEMGTMTGLFNFVKYIEMLRDNGQDLKSASSGGETADACRIMTIHKSKGLEFPVVLMYGAEKNFNYTDINKGIIWDSDLGIGISYVDTKRRIRYNIPERVTVRDKMLKEIRAEQMRLLYVAMTRAKEKLIISARLHARGTMYKKVGYDENGRVYPVFASSADSMREWIWSAVLRHPSGKRLRELAERRDIVPPADCLAEFEISLCGQETEAEQNYKFGEAEESKKADESAICERLEYKYPYSAMAKMPIKMSVSEMKRRRMPEEDYSVGLLKPPETFVTDSDEINAAERGTVTHFVMQHLDIGKTETEQQIKEQTEDMIKSGMLTLKQGAAVDTAAVFGFFESDIGKRLKKAEWFEREYDFYMLIPPEEAEPRLDTTGAEDVILQGIADCFFYTDDGIVLIDYKTDRVSKSGAALRSEAYRVQMEYYARGLSAIFNLPVKERYLYFLSCGEVVKV